MTPIGLAASVGVGAYCLQRPSIRAGAHTRHPILYASSDESGKACERRPGDTLAVVRLDRLGRSLRELLDVVETLKKRGVALLSLEEKIDTSSAAGELVFHVFGAIAQFERRLIAERTRDGMANARSKGSRPGRPPLDQEKREAAILLVKSGMSPTKAARQIGLGRSTLYREIQGQSLA
jgi:DNA invertase Pin-like site-specific DNA recombinase